MAQHVLLWIKQTLSGIQKEVTLNHFVYINIICLCHDVQVSFPSLDPLGGSDHVMTDVLIFPQHAFNGR